MKRVVQIETVAAFLFSQTEHALGLGKWEEWPQSSVFQVCLSSSWLSE